MAEMTTDERAFEAWFAKVDVLMSARAGLGPDDLPDQPYWDWFDSGYTPKQAAREALINIADEMGFGGLFD